MRRLIGLALVLASAGCTALPPARVAYGRFSAMPGPLIRVDRPQRRASTTIDVLSFNVAGLAWPARRGRAPSLAKIGRILSQLNARGASPDIILV